MPTIKVSADLQKLKELSARLSIEPSGMDHLRQIIDSIPAIICLKDKNNIILHGNKQMGELFGLSTEELAGMPVEKLTPNEAAKSFENDWDVIKTGKPKLGIIEKVTLPDGKIVWFRTDKLPYVENDEVIGIVVFSVDVTKIIMDS